MTNYNEQLRIKKLKQDYEDAVFAYIRYFSQKHGVECTGTNDFVAEFGDYYFTHLSIRIDVNENAPVGQIFKDFDEKTMLEHD